MVDVAHFLRERPVTIDEDRGARTHTASLSLVPISLKENRTLRPQFDDRSGRVRPRTEPRDPTVHAEADRAVPERLRGALPDDDEAARAVREDRERVDRGGEPLALEAAPDEEEGPRVGSHTDLGAGGAPLDVPVPRVEPLEIHAVVDDRETLAGDAVEAGDLRGAAPGDRDDVRGRREHTPLEPEHDAVEQ